MYMSGTTSVEEEAMSQVSVGPSIPDAVGSSIHAIPLCPSKRKRSNDSKARAFVTTAQWKVAKKDKVKDALMGHLILGSFKD